MTSLPEIRPAPAAGPEPGDRGLDTRALDTRALNSWVEISRGAHQRNLAFFRRLVGPSVEIAAVVKSNAYGHGWREIAASAVDGGADSFCVHSLDEALDLRAAGFTQPILVMGHVPVCRLAEAMAHDLRLVLYNPESAAELARVAKAAGRRAAVHMKLETGTYRQGVDEAGLDFFLDFLKSRPELHLEAVYTHFANIEDTTDQAYARQQLRRFEAMTERLRAAGLDFKQHAACSAATLVVPSTRFDMVRLGISQYGLWPSKETFLSYELRHPGSADVLEPVLTWKARVSQLKDVPAGSYIGYGCTHQTTRDSRLAVLPVGYADGYDRGLSSRAHVLVRGRRAPVRGRICMNLLMVDVTDVPGVTLEDEVVLLGRQGEQRVRAEDLAAWTGTIAYEIVARIREGLPRRVVE